MTRTKLVYVLPTYDAQSAEHSYHIYGFLNEAAKHLDVWLIIEHAQGNPDFAGMRVHLRRCQVPVFRILEVWLVMLWARLRGYRSFYTHYSMSSAILSALVTRFLGGRSFYWSCGHMKDFVPQRIRSLSDLGSKLRNDTLLWLTLRSVHHLVTGTATMAHYYSLNYGLELGSIRLMPNWVDLKRFENLPDKDALRHELGWPTGRKVVLFLHRLAERKGAHFILPIAEEVLSRYPHNSPKPFFVVAGDGPWRPKLEQGIRQTGLEAYFRVAGQVPNRDAVKYFAAADVYMMPSCEEGFPRTLLEAMAAGCPFSANDVGGVRDITTAIQAQFIIPTGDWRAMSDAVIILLSDDALRDQLGREGRVQVQNCDQENVVQMFVSLVSA